MTTTSPITVQAPASGLSDPALVAQQCQAITTELSDLFYERDSVVRHLMAAMLAGQHSLLLGPPGTAKSELARELTDRITGARLWEVLLTKFTSPGKLFGPVDVAALTQGVYQQVFDGRATTAHIAFIDEIFKCSTAALNELLAFLNERVYHPESGGAPISCPLLAAITASNELGDGEDAEALYDRLLVRLEVGYLTEKSNFAALLSAGVPQSVPARTTVELADLSTAVERYVPAVQVPHGVVEALWDLRTTLSRDGMIASDRRWKLATRLLKAHAFLSGRDRVNDTDLEILTSVLWNAPEQRQSVQREVLQLVNPDARQALDLADAIEEINAELDSMAGQSTDALAKWAIKEANGKLTAAGKQLAEMRHNAAAAGRSTTAVDEVIDRKQEVQTRVMKEALGVDVPLASA